MAGKIVGLGDRLGTLVRGPRRASRGMVWVQWEDRDAPMLTQRFGLRYVATNSTPAKVRETLAAMQGTGRDV